MSNNKKPALSKELSEEEKKQRQKNREKALRESRNKKNEKTKAKVKKELAKKSERKASKKARKRAAFKTKLSELPGTLKRFIKKRRVFLVCAAAALLLGIVFYFSVNSGKRSGTAAVKEESAKEKAEVTEETEEPEETAEPVSQDIADKEETVSGDKKAEKKRELKVLSDTGKDTAASVSFNMQDIYPHKGGIYLMPSENDGESIKGELLAASVYEKEEYEKLEEGQRINISDQEYIVLAVNEDAEYGTALSMAPYDEDKEKEYDKILEGKKSPEDSLGYENLVYGMTVAAEKAQMEFVGGTDYFSNDGYDDDDMIFFAGTSLYFPICYSLDTGVTLHFDKDCTLTVPDETLIKDEEYDMDDYLAGKNELYPPDLMAAKIETEGDRIVKYNVMYVPAEDMLNGK